MGGISRRRCRELAERWSREATELRRRYGEESQARLCEAHARELLLLLDEEEDEFDAVAIAEEFVSRLRKQGFPRP